MRTQKLLRLQNLKNRLDKILPMIRYGEAILETSTKVEEANLHLDTILAMGRRTASQIKAPPEYADPTGSHQFCVPGFGFPAPDQGAILKSALQIACQKQVSPVSIVMGSKIAGTVGTYPVFFNDVKEGATVLYSVNKSGNYLYRPNEPLKLTAPGKYLVKAVAQLRGHQQSDEAVAEFNLTVEKEAPSRKRELQKDGQSALNPSERKIRAISSNELPRPVPTNQNEAAKKGHEVKTEISEPISEKEQSDIEIKEAIEFNKPAPLPTALLKPPQAKSTLDALLFGGDATSEEDESD
eukprot:GHVP01017549.1.p1 GENE.GHVP01017549.1~~GHVP01017549.1.p1  ORF type:complete len:296 (-),score=62.07 GHVP01017549.1:194-1081(-)